jgi:Fic-DOC domain mobile mystery protein B
MGLKLEYHDGQTPLNDDETRGLLIKTITTHGELDEHEQLNIQNAVDWIVQSRFSIERILTKDFVKLVHKKMFGDVWAWAGSFRKTDKNIGIEWEKIGVQLHHLLDDTKYWIANESFPADEIAIRFKHRLVSIHCFPNGNGRHSRIMADVMIESIFGRDVFPWNYSNMVKADEVRKAYIAAIREADDGNIKPLLKFARD